MATNNPSQIKLVEAFEAVHSISSRNIFNFGLKIGLNNNTIETFQLQYTRDAKGWLRAILSERLKQAPPLTWHDIVTALRSPLVGEYCLASPIESQYMTHSQPPSSVPQHRGTQLSSVPQHRGTQLPSVPQHQGTQLSSVPQHQGTQLSSVPQQQETQLSAVPQHQGTQLSAVPQQQETQLSAVPQQQETQLSSVPQQQETQLSSVPQQQGTQLSAVPQQQETQLSAVSQQQGTQPSVAQQEGNQLSAVPQPDRYKSSAPHTSAVPSLQPSVSANSAPPQASLGYSMRQPLILPHNFWGHLFYHQQGSHDPLQPPNPPPHPSYFTHTQYPPFTPSPYGQLQSQPYLSQLYQSPYQPMGYLNNMFPIPRPFPSPTATGYPPHMPPQLPGISLSQNPVVSSQHDGNSSTRSESGSTYSVPSGSTHCGDGNSFNIHSGFGDGRSHGGADSSKHSGSGSIHSGSSGSTHGSNDSSIHSSSGSSGSTHNVNSPVHRNSDSVLEESGPPAKRTRQEPSVRPLSHNTTDVLSDVLTDASSVSRQPTPTHTSATPPLQSHSQSRTTDRTPSVSQLRATQTTPHPTPNPLLTDDSSDSRQPPPTHTSATPPLQSSPHPQSAVSGSPAYHQSRIETVEDVINIHRSALTRAVGNNLTYFSNKFIELGFISSEAYENIRTKLGVGEREKGSHLLSLVTDNASTARDKKEWLQKFISVFSQERAYSDLGTTMTECSSNIYTSPTAYAAHLPPDPSFQSHSHTIDRPSLSSQVGRSQVKSHNEPQSVHTQSQASSHSPSSQMQQLIDYVKTVYQGSEVERDPKVVKLQKMPTKVYINLVCIDRKSVDNAREYDEVTRTMVQEGSLDVVYGKKWPIDFNEIAANLPATSASFDRVVLVEGAPGVGKSTFALEFCRRWERGEIAQQYQLVLLLRLREERISNAKSLEDLIYHPSMEVCQTVKRELEYNLGVNTLIILEGFDELPDRCQRVGSIFMDLIAGKLLRLTTVLVTSRPWATRKMLKNHENRIYQHIEILGFKDHQITEYIESTLPQDKASDLKAYLESHPQIRAGMYIPLNSAIVVTVYEESQASGYAMPTTLTELYTSLTRTILLRYLRGHPEYETDDIVFVQKFKDLPQAIYAKFCEVCELAYSGTVGTKCGVKLIYRKSDMPSDFDNLGFMDSVIELYETRPEATSYNFLHLTFQEFFAAVHIFNKSPEEQVEHFKRHKEGRLKVVLRFLAGLNKLNCFSIEEIANNFFQTPSTREGSRYLIPCDAAVGIDLVQWLFEAQNDGVIEHVLGQKTIEFGLSSKMLPLDYYSLGYCLSHSQCQWVLGLGKKIGEDEVRMLAAGAGTRSEPRGRVTGLKRKQTERSNSQMKEKSLLSLSGKCLSMLFTEWKSILCLHQLSMELPARCDQITWPDLSALRVLELEIKGYTKRKLETLLHGLSLESLTVLHSHDEDWVAIGNHITSTTTLKELCILSSDIIEKGVEAITAALASNQSLPLERLELECECTFTATAGLAQFITNTTTLKYLSIKKCTFSAHALLVLARAIHHNSILQTKNVEEFMLTVNGDIDAKGLAQLLKEYPDLVEHNIVNLSNSSISDAGAVALAQALHHNSTLTQLNLSNNSISDAGAVALAQALHHNSTLTHLYLSNNSISDAGAVALAQALHHNSTLTHLYLFNNSISDAGAVALAQALHHNSTLTHLYLSNNSISDAGAVALAQALHHNSTLTQLNLSNNSISDAGAVALAQALHHNSTLTHLYLSNNSISDTGAVALAQALHHNSTLTKLHLYGNDGIGEEGTHQLVQALTVNTSIREHGLWLPRRCEEYAKQCPQYHTVSDRIWFRDSQ